jgi:hypothetical protein
MVEMPNPTGLGLKPIQKGERRAGTGRPSGAPNRFPQELKQAMLDAASEVGEINEEPILDRDGNPTGMTRLTATGKDGLKGYLKWAAIHRANAFLRQLGRIMPKNTITKTETRPVVRYETAEERRAAMIERGWPPAVLQAMEDALEPKFLQDLRAEKKAKAIEAVVVVDSEAGD